MCTVFSCSQIPDFSIELVTLTNKHCQVTVVPSIGGRISSIRLDLTNEELLWHNKNVSLIKHPSGTPYDTNFYGGIDELLPCDLPETIDGIVCPDHGELWTTSLTWQVKEDVLILEGVLPLVGLTYRREMQLSEDSPGIISNYHIGNPTKEIRHFLWKLHAALLADPGDTVHCSAVYAKPADDAYTTCKSMEPFLWPNADDVNKSVIPRSNGSSEFLYLYGLTEGTLGFTGKQRHVYFNYSFDKTVFPYPWLFQSFGGFEGHEVTVLEPCTNMPILVNEAIIRGQCASLLPNAEMSTKVCISFGYLSDDDEPVSLG